MTMFSWAITFLIVAIVAALLGFGGIAGTAAWMAKLLFLLGLALFVLFLLLGRRPPALKAGGPRGTDNNAAARGPHGPSRRGDKKWP
jgi:uncharacterized membrane protein YtjA (UPF0391 family)